MSRVVVHNYLPKRRATDCADNCDCADCSRDRMPLKLRSRDADPKFRKGQRVNIVAGLNAPGEGVIMRVAGRMSGGTVTYDLRVTKSRFSSLVGETTNVLETDLRV